MGSRLWGMALVLLLVGGARAEDQLHVEIHGSGGRGYQIAVQRFIDTAMPSDGARATTLRESSEARLPSVERRCLRSGR